MKLQLVTECVSAKVEVRPPKPTAPLGAVASFAGALLVLFPKLDWFFVAVFNKE